MRFKKILLPLITSLAIVSSSEGCARLGWLLGKSIPVDIPDRPKLAQCPVKPEIEGTVERVNGNLVVVMPLESAKTLQAWTRIYPVCMTTNVVILDGHVEKLENRLKALRGDGG